MIGPPENYTTMSRKGHSCPSEDVSAHAAHDLLFTGPKDRLEKFEGKEKAGCDLFENAAGLS